MLKIILVAIGLLSLNFSGDGFGQSISREKIEKISREVEQLRQLHEKLPPAGPHDWLASHHEPGQRDDQWDVAKLRTG